MERQNLYNGTFCAAVSYTHLDVYKRQRLQLVTVLIHNPLVNDESQILLDPRVHTMAITRRDATCGDFSPQRQNLKARKFYMGNRWGFPFNSDCFQSLKDLEFLEKKKLKTFNHWLQ